MEATNLAVLYLTKLLDRTVEMNSSTFCTRKMPLQDPIQLAIFRLVTFRKDRCSGLLLASEVFQNSVQEFYIAHQAAENSNLRHSS